MFKRSHFHPKPHGKGIIKSFAGTMDNHNTTVRNLFSKGLEVLLKLSKWSNRQRKLNQYICYIKMIWLILSFVIKSDFYVESTCTCDVCKIDVKLSFRGKANWNSHLESHVYRENEGKMAKRKSLMTWFQKSMAKSKAAASFTPMLSNKLLSSSSLAILVSSKSLADSIGISGDKVQVVDGEPALTHYSSPSALF